MSTKTFAIIIGVIIAVMIPMILLNSMIKLKEKAKNEENNGAVGSSPTYIVVEVRDSSILVSNPKEKSSLVVAHFSPDIIYDSKNNKIKNHIFEVKQEVKISASAIQESYPGTFANVTKIKVVSVAASEEDYKAVKKVYEDYLSWGKSN